MNTWISLHSIGTMGDQFHLDQTCKMYTMLPASGTWIPPKLWPIMQKSYYTWRGIYPPRLLQFLWWKYDICHEPQRTCSLYEINFECLSFGYLFNKIIHQLFIPRSFFFSSLAAWFRLKYPHIAVGALASSAPLLYFDDITPTDGFHSVVTKNFRVRINWFV